MARMLLDAVGPPAPAPQQATAAASQGRDPAEQEGPAGLSQSFAGSEAAASGSTDSSSADQQHSRQAEAWRHWGAALPSHVPIAFAHASEAELRGVGEEGLAAEALAVRRLMLDSHQVSSIPHFPMTIETQACSLSVPGLQQGEVQPQLGHATPADVKHLAVVLIVIQGQSDARN